MTRTVNYFMSGNSESTSASASNIIVQCAPCQQCYLLNNKLFIYETSSLLLHGMHCLLFWLTNPKFESALILTVMVAVCDGILKIHNNY